MITVTGVIQLKGQSPIRLDGRRKFFKFAKQLLPHLSSLVEEIRIAQSQTSSNRTLTGTLRLSVLRSDYLALSDNTTGWTSCLSIKRNGSYCAGCLEMATSPYAIVAAVVDPTGRKYWRQIILLTPAAIIGLRGYPFNEPTVTERALTLVSQFAEKPYSAVMQYARRNNFNGVTLTTNAMYNDAYLGGYFLPSLDNPSPQVLNYSGPAYCLSCGKPLETAGAEGEVLCFSCSGKNRCSCCGEIKDLDSLIFDADLDDYICFYCDELSREENPN